MKEYPLPAMAKPHTVELDPKGTPWYSGNMNGTIGKLDPATGKVTEYKMPDPNAKDPHTMVFNKEGTLFFTLQNSNMVGRLNPKTGEATEWDSPSGPRSHPYAIVVMNGGVWYNESGVRPDALVRFDIKSETFQSWPIPSGRIHAGIWRHGRSTREGNLLIHQSATNRIIQVTPRQKAASRQQT